MMEQQQSSFAICDESSLAVWFERSINTGILLIFDVHLNWSGRCEVLSEPFDQMYKTCENAHEKFVFLTLDGPRYAEAFTSMISKYSVKCRNKLLLVVENGEEEECTLVSNDCNTSNNTCDSSTISTTYVSISNEDGLDSMTNNQQEEDTSSNKHLKSEASSSATGQVLITTNISPTNHSSSTADSTSVGHNNTSAVDVEENLPASTTTSKNASSSEEAEMMELQVDSTTPRTTDTDTDALIKETRDDTITVTDSNNRSMTSTATCIQEQQEQHQQSTLLVPAVVGQHSDTSGCINNHTTSNCDADKEMNTNEINKHIATLLDNDDCITSSPTGESSPPAGQARLGGGAASRTSSGNVLSKEMLHKLISKSESGCIPLFVAVKGREIVSIIEGVDYPALEKVVQEMVALSTWPQSL
jgi:hypothetical protein